MGSAAGPEESELGPRRAAREGGGSRALCRGDAGSRTQDSSGAGEPWGTLRAESAARRASFVWLFSYFRRLEHIPHEETLRELGFLSCKKKRLQADLIVAYQSLKGAYKHEGDRHFTCAVSNRTMGFSLPSIEDVPYSARATLT